MDIATVPIKVFLISSGLGHINRGYESFTQECFNTLSQASDLDVVLYKGGGPSSSRQQTLWNLPRNSAAGRRLGQGFRKNGYWTEQVTFTLSLLPHIKREKPDIIYFSDCNIGNLLWHWRSKTNRRFKLLLSNGGPLKPPFPRWDYVQQVAPIHAEAALAVGQDPQRQCILPYGIEMSSELTLLTQAQKVALRTELILPTDRPILLSVGAINTSHKRIDYIIREVASLPEPPPYLVILGQRDEETSQIEELAQQRLGEENYVIRTVPHSKVSDYYKAADAFALASLSEGLPRVSLEAMSYGLPCLAHDYELMHYVLGTQGYLGDLNQSGELAKLMCNAMAECQSVSVRQRRHQECYQRFAWQSLKAEYISMLQQCADSRINQT